ncbi:thioesterase family protein [Streptomyces sp. YS415]|uniref:acyl-CoA thioesterase n=1 Tax=Streptomyces sp. YS415 TaxID=2944806 RepID=UPI002020CC4E|nr:thioesterase family protein [Streptomyces sp. YS415]MCL7429404.1 thioesterase family protein [Streptomyces sp. YS415]
MTTVTADGRHGVGAHGTVPVYFDDLDSYGMVHHGRYAVLLERAVMAHWAARDVSLGGTGTPGTEQVVQVVRALELTYQAPITRIGEIRVHFWIDHVGRTSYRYAFRLLSADGSVVHATGRRTQVNLDPATLRPAPLPADLLRVAEPFMSEEARASLTARTAEVAVEV